VIETAKAITPLRLFRQSSFSNPHNLEIPDGSYQAAVTTASRPSPEVTQPEA